MGNKKKGYAKAWLERAGADRSRKNTYDLRFIKITFRLWG